MVLDYQNVFIPIAHDLMGGYYVTPQGRPRGAIVMIQEIFGVTPAMRSIADDYAEAGYAVLVPDIYWRLERDLSLGNGEDPAQRDSAVDYSKRYDEEIGTRDLVAAARWLENKLAIKPAVLGFCLGGRMAVRLAAATEMSAMVSMYGVGLEKHRSEILGITCPVQLHFGDNDNHNPIKVIDSIEKHVTDRGNADDEFFIYPGAEHAFYNRYRSDRFNDGAHRQARERALQFLAKCAERR